MEDFLLGVVDAYLSVIELELDLMDAGLDVALEFMDEIRGDIDNYIIR